MVNMGVITECKKYTLLCGKVIYDHYTFCDCVNDVATNQQNLVQTGADLLVQRRPPVPPSPTKPDLILLIGPDTCTTDTASQIQFVRPWQSFPFVPMGSARVQTRERVPQLNQCEVKKKQSTPSGPPSSTHGATSPRTRAGGSTTRNTSNHHGPGAPNGRSPRPQRLRTNHNSNHHLMAPRGGLLPASTPDRVGGRRIYVRHRRPRPKRTHLYFK